MTVVWSPRAIGHLADLRAYIARENPGAAARTARTSTLRANTTSATNTIKDPKRIVPVSATLNIKGEHISYVVPRYSIQVLEVDLK